MTNDGTTNDERSERMRPNSERRWLPVSFVIRHSSFAILWLLAIVPWLSAAELTNSATASPFLRLRDATLGYHGPEGDFTNLTEIRIGWFGPTNLNDPLTGDLWWAANLAMCEANEPRKAATERGVYAASPPELAGVSGRLDFISRGALKRPEGRAPSPFADSSFQMLPFRLVPRWAVDPWGTGVSQLTRMVYDEQPLALLGSMDSAATHLAEQVVAKANLPLVSPIATDNSVTLAGVSWMFSCAPSDAAIARVLVDDILTTLSGGGFQPSRGSRRKEAPTEKFEIRNSKFEIVQSLPRNGRMVSGCAELTARQERVLKTPHRSPQFLGPMQQPSAVAPTLLTSAATSEKTALALLAGTDHESRMTTREVVKEFSRRGRMPGFRFEVPPGAHAIDRQMSALEEARPAAVLIIARAEDSARLTQAVRDKLEATAIFGGPSMSRRRFIELAGPAAEGVRFPLLFVPNSADTNASLFAARFTSEHHRPPDYAAALTYDATRLLIEAIRCAGPNRARIREALTQLSPWPGIAGPISFDGTGQNTRANIGMGTIRDGTIIPLSRPSSPNPTTTNAAKL